MKKETLEEILEELATFRVQKNQIEYSLQKIEEAEQNISNMIYNYLHTLPDEEDKF